MIYWIQRSIRFSIQKLRLPLSSVAILSRSNRQAEEIAQKMRNHGLRTEYMEGRKLDLNKECVKSLTIHAAKGLEFPVVALGYVEEGNLPNWSNYSDELGELELNLQRRLLYVGCSRAMRRLLVAYRKGMKSRFLQDLSCWKMDSIK